MGTFPIDKYRLETIGAAECRHRHIHEHHERIFDRLARIEGLVGGVNKMLISGVHARSSWSELLRYVQPSIALDE